MIYFKLCCICENGGKSIFLSYCCGKKKMKKNVNNSVFSPTSTVMLRNIALACKLIRTWLLT